MNTKINPLPAIYPKFDKKYFEIIWLPYTKEVIKALKDDKTFNYSKNWNEYKKTDEHIKKYLTSKK